MTAPIPNEGGTLAGKPADARAHDAPGLSWRRELAEAIRDPAELLRILGLPLTLLPAAKQAGESFPLLVPRGFVARMRPGDPADPLLRQVLPVADEGVVVPGFVTIRWRRPHAVQCQGCCTNTTAEPYW